MQLIHHVLIISIVTVGAHLAICELLTTFYEAPENIYLDAKGWRKHLMKPMFYCPTCMASIWGTVLHFRFGGSIAEWIPVCLALAYTNTLFAKWVN